MKTDLKPAVLLFVLLTVLTGIAYPLALTGIAQLAFPLQAHGDARLIGKATTDPKQFWSRPSASNYDLAASGGSNLGPLNPALADAVRERIAALRAADPGNTAPVPADLVTASASGLDPHISPAAARYQAARIARLRGLPVERVMALIEQHTEGAAYGLLGAPRVNVGEINAALDREPQSAP